MVVTYRCHILQVSTDNDNNISNESLGTGLDDVDSSSENVILEKPLESPECQVAFFETYQM